MSSAARRAVEVIASTASRSSVPGAVRSASTEASPMMPVRRLLKSWATPPASCPTASSFCDWRSCSSAARAASSASRSRAISRASASLARASSSVRAATSRWSTAGERKIRQESPAKASATAPATSHARRSQGGAGHPPPGASESVQLPFGTETGKVVGASSGSPQPAKHATSCRSGSSRESE
ncbi:MAG: hypothetical protein QM704_22815 [Anaeromyxobacteraceae bacterium]